MAVQATLSGIYNVATLRINFGLLYNWYAVDNVLNIAATGWHVPTSADIYTLRTTLGGTLYEGGKLKDTESLYWNAPNTGATNEVNFLGRGGGMRVYSTGAFAYLKEYSFIRATTEYGALPTNYSYFFQLAYDNDNFYIAGLHKNAGTSVRLVKDVTLLSDGQTDVYTGNNGQTYRTICIGTQEWTASNIIETKYRDLSDIPEVTLAATWIGLTTGALCAYNNDWNNL